MDTNQICTCIAAGEAVVGLELGSTRIKAMLIAADGTPLASGSFDWENRLENNIWTYHLDDVWTGVQTAYKNLVDAVNAKYGVQLTKVKALGFSAMMHGYLAFDKDDNLLVPFRTWRNTMTEQAAADLTERFGFNIPQRWSIAHLHQAILNGEEHVKDIAFVTTLAGYVHWKLTGEKVLGIGDASGMLPIDSETNAFDAGMIEKFDALHADKEFGWKLAEVLPKVLAAGENAGVLTAAGAKLLDPTGTLEAGAPIAPPEGDAGTGMAATNSVRVRTGNVSAGTSIFSMVVLEKPLSKVHVEIDMVTTPSGKPVAMAHCNNCTSDINAWASLVKSCAEALGVSCTMPQALDALFYGALDADPDCGGLVSYNYVSGEPMTGMEEGRPLFVRLPDSKFTFQNFARAQIYSAMAALKIGMDILIDEEKV
ncbi:MAG: ATPase, partial [Clostridia bacterium]|nr:ATPase [Clostridia bacterium]